MSFDLARVAAQCDQRRIRIRYWPDEARIRVSTHVFAQDLEINASSTLSSAA